MKKEERDFICDKCKSWGCNSLEALSWHWSSCKGNRERKYNREEMRLAFEAGVWVKGKLCAGMKCDLDFNKWIEKHNEPYL